MTYESQENELLYYVCYYSLLPNPHEYIFNSRTIRDHMQISRYKARKYLKSLEEQGLICKAYIGGQDEDGNVGCYCGYIITEKMCNTAVYEQAQDDVVKYVKDWLRKGW